MKVVRIRGKEQVELVDRPEPRPRGEFVVVKVEVAPMCTEYKGFKQGWVNDCLGHEAAGTVVATDGVRRVAEGQRVLVLPQYPCGRCRFCLRGEYVYCEQSLDALEATGNEAGTATYAQYLLKQDWMLYPIPDDLSTEHASLANCALGPALGGLKLAKVSGLDTVLVTGLGPVGLGAVLLAKWMGARVAAVDPIAYRRQLAVDLGADDIFDSSEGDALDRVRSIGIDTAIECSGSPLAQRFGIDAVRRLGTIVFVGEAKELTV
ncbi:MAG TPA: zinc-binding dehydrogenase, partial [Fimbriimonas sp.]